MSEGPERKTSGGHIPGADGFRAIACIAVFFRHIANWHCKTQAERLGWLGDFMLSGDHGVAAFFVLSGFLLSTPFWKAFRSGRGMPDLRVYAVRRLGRIVPGYCVCVLVLALINHYFVTWPRLLSYLTFTNTFFSTTYYPFFDPPLWSIGIEMLFYVLLPLYCVGLFQMGGRRSAWAYTVVVMGLIVLGQMALLKAAPGIEQALQRPAIFRAASSVVERNAGVLFSHFLIGVLAAEAYLELSERHKSKSGVGDGQQRWFNGFDGGAVCLFVSIALLLSTPAAKQVPGLSDLWNFPTAVYHWPLLHVLFGALLVCMGLSRRVGGWLDTRVLSWVAVVSFGVYIWHIPIMNGLAAVWPNNRDGSFLAAGVFASIAWVLTCTVAAGSYGLVERPVLNWVHRYRPAVAGGAMGVEKSEGSEESGGSSTAPGLSAAEGFVGRVKMVEKSRG